MVWRAFDHLGDRPMARSILISAALLCLSATVALPQQTPCGPYSDMTHRLKSEYDEQLLCLGIDAVGRMLEIWGSADGWTVIAVRPADMMSCVMLIGEKGTQWQTVEPQPVGPKS